MDCHRPCLLSPYRAVPCSAALFQALVHHLFGPWRLNGLAGLRCCVQREIALFALAAVIVFIHPRVAPCGACRNGRGADDGLIIVLKTWRSTRVSSCCNNASKDRSSCLAVIFPQVVWSSARWVGGAKVSSIMRIPVRRAPGSCPFRSSWELENPASTAPLSFFAHPTTHGGSGS
jgi:hypothetical protein